MKKVLIIAITVLAFGAVSAQNINNDPYVEVRGVAKTQVTPNKATIEIELNQADSKGKISMEELENQLAAAMKLANIDIEKQLVLANQSSEAQKKNKSYQFKSYQLTVSSAVEVRQVFEALQQSGIQNAQLTRIWNNNMKKVEEDLKVQAVYNAENEAKILAMALHQSIGKALMITSFSYNNDGVYMPRMYAKSATGAVSADNSALPETDFRPLNIEQSVTIRFELK